MTVACGNWICMLIEALNPSQDASYSFFFFALIMALVFMVFTFLAKYYTYFEDRQKFSREAASQESKDN